MRATLVVLALMSVAATSGPEDTQPQDAQPPPQLSQPDARRAFSAWLEGVRAEALSRGIREEIVDRALGSLEEPLPVVVERDRTQAEAVETLETYVARRITPKVVKTGRGMLARHRTLIDEVGSRYGVPPAVIASIWGLESNFGRFSGVRPTVAALATLAWDPRRSALFRGELFDALEILNRGDIDVDRMRGSWAGAMGQVQFMPSSYLRFAEDFDGDGRRDIWSTPADVFASIANYLKGYGWIDGQSWGREVDVPPAAAQQIAGGIERRTGTCRAKRDMTVAFPVKRWQELGVRARHGEALPDDTPDAAIVSGRTRYFLVYRNYDALLDYNCAHSYAIAVGLLADRIHGAGSRAASPARSAASVPGPRSSGQPPRRRIDVQ